jgi:predicted lipoprotein with Yx(FWY)xxD motif
VTRFRILLLALVCLAASLLLAACGGDDETSTTETSSSAPSPGGSAGTVALADNADLGEILVDGDGKTLYLFEKDDEAGESYCDGACAKAWPPFETADPQAGSGVDAARLTTFEREDGSTQVAYAGHPLYYYAGDQSPGDVNGNDLDDFGAEWYALDTAGDPAEGEEAGAQSTTTTTDSGYSAY